MNESLLTSNLDFLTRYFPALTKVIQRGALPSSTCQPEIVEGKRGFPTARIVMNGTAHYLHSRYDPVSEAERWASGSAPDDGSVALLVGWGMGYHTIEWVKQHGRRVKAVVIIEPEPALFLSSLSTIDLRQLTAAPRVEIVLGESGDELYQTLLKQMEHILCAGLSTFTLPFIRIYPTQTIDTIRSTLQTLTVTKEKMLDHMAGLGYRCQENIIRNINAISDCFFPRDLRNAAKGIPAIVIAAGPSLDRNVHLLAKARERAWLIAADTSLRVLKQHSIEPHIVVTKDPTELNRAHFEEFNNIQTIALAFDPQADPSIPPRFTGPRILLPNRNNAIHQHLKGLELQPDDALPLSVNAAATAFNLAVAMGCDQIVFTGLDLCFSNTEGPSHAAGSALRSKTFFSAAEGTLTYSRDAMSDVIDVFEVEGIDGKHYPTSATFHEALRQLETSIQDAGVTCIDASEGGAKIAGTEIIPLAQVLEQLDTPPVNPGILFQRSPPARNRKAILRSIQSIAEHIGYCGKISQTALETKPRDLSIPPRWIQAQEQIEEGYLLYHELQSALERVLVEISRPHFWEEDPKQPDALRERYQWYFSEILRACETFGMIFRGFG